MVAVAQNLMPPGFSCRPKTHTPLLNMQVSGLRYYNPKLGRWLTRDPIAEEGWLLVYSRSLPRRLRWDEVINLYAFVKNAPVGDVDLLGNLRLSSGRPRGRGCGGFIWIVEFITEPQEITGYIIQEITYRHVANDCSGANLPNYPKQKTFFEAIEVRSGENKWDIWNRPSLGECTYGVSYVRGVAAFVWTSQLPPNWPNRPWYWGLRRNWISNYITRTLTASWVCCRSGSTTVWTTP